MSDEIKQNPNERIHKDEVEVTLACPLCKERIKIYNKIIVSGATPENKEVSFKVRFKQVFYDITCNKCNVTCIPVEEEKRITDEKK